MYHIKSNAVVSRIESDCRTFRAVMEFGGTSYSGADIGRIRIEHKQSEDGTIQIGGILSRHAEIRLHTDRLPAKGDVFSLYLYLLDWGEQSTEITQYRYLTQYRHEELAALTHAQIRLLGQYKEYDGIPLDDTFIPMGNYVVSGIRVRTGETRLDCYDKLGADKLYTPTVAFPADSFDVVDDAIHQLGIRGRSHVSGGYLVDASGGYVLTASGQKIITSAEYAFTIDTAPPDGTTCREILGWIAAMYGGNGILDRDGRYTTVFAASDIVSLKTNRINDPDIAGEQVRLRGLRCVIDDETILTAGESSADTDDPLVAEFRCPYMTSERLAALWSRLRRLAWMPGSVTERLGDPRRDLGDKLRVPRKGGQIAMLVSGVTFDFDGGLMTENESCGNTEDVQTEEVS